MSTNCTAATNPSLISDCDEFTAGPTAWPYVLEAVNVSAGAISQGTQTFTMNVTNYQQVEQHLELQKQQLMETGSSDLLKQWLLVQTVSVSAVTFNRTVKFQFSTGM